MQNTTIARVAYTEILFQAPHPNTCPHIKHQCPLRKEKKCIPRIVPLPPPPNKKKTSKNQETLSSPELSSAAADRRSRGKYIAARRGRGWAHAHIETRCPLVCSLRKRAQTQRGRCIARTRITVRYRRKREREGWRGRIESERERGWHRGSRPIPAITTSNYRGFPGRERAAERSLFFAYAKHVSNIASPDRCWRLPHPPRPPLSLLRLWTYGMEYIFVMLRLPQLRENHARVFISLVGDFALFAWLFFLLDRSF